MKLRFEKQNLLLSVNEETLIASAQRIKSKAKIAPIVFNYRFRSLERMNEFLEEYISRNEKAAMEREAIKNQKKLASEKFEHQFKIGDILYESWGYEQTNVKYFQIVGFKGKSAILRQIVKNYVKDTSWASAMVEPLKDQFISEPFMKRISANVSYNGSISYNIKMGDVIGWLYLHKDGQQNYCSWYA